MEKQNVVRKDGGILRLVEFIIYVIFVLLGFYLGFQIRFKMEPIKYNIDPFYESMLYIAVVSLVIFYIYDITNTLKKSMFENILIIGLSLMIINICSIAIVFFNRGFGFPRSVFIISFLIQLALIVITKLIILKILSRDSKSEKVLIVANESEKEYIKQKILGDKFNNDNIKFIYDNIEKSINNYISKVSKVYIGSSIPYEDKYNIIEFCSTNNKTVYLVPSLFEISLAKFKISQVSDLLLFKIEDMGLSYEEKIIKRFFDVIISLMGLIILSPVMIIVSVIIKFYDKGPILFKQERVTENNKVFNLYKYRTMIVDAEKHTGPVLATDKDPRITPLGRVLRATRIDEIPQLLNVLKGDMSIVGPRPERPFFVEQFNEEYEEFKYRVFVKAGITGLAQVMGRYSTDPRDKARYDLLYIKNYSLLLDIKIIFNTIKIMFIKDSSEGVSSAGMSVEEKL